MSEQTLDTVVQDLVVGMEYVLTVDGEKIDSSEGYGPLEFIQGHRNIIPGLEKELFGMQIGEHKEVIVEPQDGYGEYDNDAFVDLPRSQFPPQFQFEVGKAIRLSDPNGRLINANILEVGENDIRLDLNHPLAGKKLNFSATIVSLRKAREDELASGRVGGGGCASCGGDSSDGCGGGCG